MERAVFIRTLFLFVLAWLLWVFYKNAKNIKNHEAYIEGIIKKTEKTKGQWDR